MAVLNSLLFSYTFYLSLRELFGPLLAFRQTSSLRFWMWQNKEGQNGKGGNYFSRDVYVHVSFANRRHFGSMLSEKWPLYSKRSTPAPRPLTCWIRFDSIRRLGQSSAAQNVRSSTDLKSETWFPAHVLWLKVYGWIFWTTWKQKHYSQLSWYYYY